MNENRRKYIHFSVQWIELGPFVPSKLVKLDEPFPRYPAEMQVDPWPFYGMTLCAGTVTERTRLPRTVPCGMTNYSIRRIPDKDKDKETHTFTGDPVTCSFLILTFVVTPHIHRIVIISFNVSLFCSLLPWLSPIHERWSYHCSVYFPFCFTGIVLSHKKCVETENRC